MTSLPSMAALWRSGVSVDPCRSRAAEWVRELGRLKKSRNDSSPAFQKFAVSSTQQTTPALAMAGRSKKKGTRSCTIAASLYTNSHRHLWCGEELHHPHSRREEAADFAPRLQKTMHLQGNLSPRAAQQEEGLQGLHRCDHLLLHQGHPVPAP